MSPLKAVITMWLVHAKTARLVQFPRKDTVTPPYAILSHVWEEKEMSFQALQNSSVPLEYREGSLKFRYFCQRAIADGFDWVWMDTCCIDKTSSAELSEAINSMYRWYRDAARCYVYLYDLAVLDSKNRDDPGAEDSRFRKTKWFTRGWTLQELLAPRDLVFVVPRFLFHEGEETKANFKGLTWDHFGTKAGLAEVIEEITGIDVGVLQGKILLDDVSVAKRMSWASQRETTRVEDVAYSLMGIFNVNMPTLYGEGDMAFIRLQLEILKTSSDQSIFAWGKIFDLQELLQKPKAYSTVRFVDDFRCLLARSPQMFHDVAEVETMGLKELAKRLSISIDTPEYASTNYGLRIPLPLFSVEHGSGSNTQRFVLGMLACQQGSEILALVLQSERADTRRYRVGLFAIAQQLNPWFHPLYRIVRIPAADSLARTVLERIQRPTGSGAVYIMSHNPSPMRSLDIGRVDGHVRSRDPSPTPEVATFVIQAWLIRRLSERGFALVASENGGKPGWRVSPDDFSKVDNLAITVYPGSGLHSVALFRNGDTGEAFALALGLPEPTDVRADVLLKDADADGTLWEGPADVVAARMWERCQGKLGEASCRVDRWLNSTKTFTTEDPGDSTFVKGVRISVARSRSVTTIDTAGRMYSVGIKLIRTKRKAPTSRLGLLGLETRTTSDAIAPTSAAEHFWNDHRAWLSSIGLTLKSRYRPARKTWQSDGDDQTPSQMDFSYAVRKSDGATVTLKKVKPSAHPYEVPIGRYFSSGLIADDPRNHCCPIYDVLQVPDDDDALVIVMPLLREYDDPSFTSVGEALECFRQVFEGLQFMHSLNVAHRDCTRLSIMMDATPLYPKTYRPLSPLRKFDVHRFFSRTERPTRYYITNFGLSRRYNRDETEPLAKPTLGADKTVPEFLEDPEKPRNPFHVDVYCLGNVLRRDILEVYQNFDFLEPLVKAMVADDPAARPTMEEAFGRLNEQLGSLSAWKLRSLPVRRADSWLVTFMRRLWHMYRTALYVVRGLEALPTPWD